MIARLCYKIILILRSSPVSHCLFKQPVKSFFTLKRDGRRIVNQNILKIHVTKLSSLSSQDKLQHCSMLGKIKFSSQAALEAFVTFNLHPFIGLISHSICILSLQDRQQVQKQKTDNIQANMHGLPKPYSSFNSTFFLIFNCFFPSLQVSILEVNSVLLYSFASSVPTVPFWLHTSKLQCASQLKE